MGINKWHKKPLKSLCTRIGDGLHGTPTYDESSEFYFINGNNLKNGKIEITNNTNTVTKEDFNKNFIPLNENTLLLSINGTLGSMAFYNNEKIMLGKSAAYINFKEDVNKFYYYYFQLKEIQEYFHNVATGSTIKNLSLKSIQDFEVPTPDKIELKNISNVLSSLDSKIELNNKINKELEAMAKTLYDYWFVQFDFPDKNGKPYKSSGGKMVYNQELKREIPEGWEVCRLEDIEDNIITGKTPPKINPEYFNGNIPFITIGDIRGNMHIVSTEETLSKLGADYQSSKYINKGALCISCIASPGLIGFATRLSQTNQQINSIESKKEENSYYLYFALNDFFNASKAKTGNTFPNMNKGDFADIKLIKPNEQVLLSFSKKIKSSIEQIYINSEQNQELAKLRDWLLPMLMNGQVRVK
jgi:type I restriction enzyme S subunit